MGGKSFTKGPNKNSKGKMKDSEIQLLDSYTFSFSLHAQVLHVKICK